MKIILAFLLVMMFFSLTFTVSAFVLQPVKFEINFEPGLTKDIGYSVGDFKGSGILNLRMFAIGDLNKSISLNENTTNLTPDEWKSFGAKIILPQTLKPGTHTNGIIVEEMPSEPTQGVGSVAGVMIPIYVYVPYPGKYIEELFTTENVALGEDVDFKIVLINKGKENINKIFANIEIYDSYGKKIDTVRTNEVALKMNEKDKISAKWNSSIGGVGVYKTKANIDYDGNILESNSEFRVGDILLEVSNVTVESSFKNSIAKINVQIQSKWNNQLDNIYYDVFMYGAENSVLTSARSQSFSVYAWEQKNVTSYLDLKNIGLGMYPAKIVIYYYDKTADYNFNVSVIEPKSKVFTITNIMIILIVLIALIVFLFLKKKKIKLNEN